MKDGVKFQGPFEELTFAAIYLLVSLKRDKALFKQFSPVYDDNYIAAMEAQKNKVEQLTAPKQLTGEMKLITRMVASDYTRVRNMVNRLESYLDKVTEPLTISVADFGIRQTRNELNARNDEGIVRQLRVLHKNMESNKSALEPKGYTEEISTEVKALITSLVTNSTAQNIKKEDRKVLTRENIGEMNKLWKMMSEVMDDGKKIAKEQQNTAMAKDYTFSDLQKKVRLDRKSAGENKQAVA